MHKEIYDRDLNEEQRAAVTAGNGPVLVIAGAGSGKTRVVTYRVSWLLESGVDPENILLVTFTNKAAHEMLERVNRLTGDRAAKVWGGTFHHIANVILRRYADRLDYQRNYTILDRDDALQLIKQSIDKDEAKSFGRGFPKPNVLAAVLGYSRNTRTPVSDTIDSRYPHLVELSGTIRGISERYDLRKRELNAMDFDDLLVNCHELLSNHEDVRRELAMRLRHVLVDEYQDTNVLQAEIVDLLASCHQNITVVGDDAQSIYSFRGASVSNILEFPERYPGAQVFHLETNYRSTPPVLRAANSSISRNRDQFVKRLRADREGDVLPAVIGVRDAYRQAEFVADRTGQILDDGVPASEIAILYRAHYHSMEIQTELAARGIPFEVRGGAKFFEQRHVKDVVSFLRVLDNPMDEISWKRILLLCPGVGSKTAEKIWQKLAATGDPLSAAAGNDLARIFRGKTSSGVALLSPVFRDLCDHRDANDGAELVDCVLRGLYDSYMRSEFADYSDRIMDIEQLADLAGSFDDPAEFLGGLALMTDVAEPGSEKRPLSGDRVVLSTVHQAKGLEWKAVFLVWLVDGKMPSARSLPEPGGEEEERRLFYVALTRAKDELYLLYPAISMSRDSYGMGNAPSRFIMELEPETFQHHGTGSWHSMEWEW